MAKIENLINSIEKIADNGYYEFITQKNSISIEKCKHKSNITVERRIELDKSHEIIEGFVITNHRTGEKIYFLLANWIGYQLSMLLMSVEKFILGANQVEISEINRVLEKLRLFFKNKKNYRKFTIKQFTEAQNYRLKNLLTELKIEFEDWKLHKYLYNDIYIKIEYLEFLLVNQKKNLEIEKTDLMISHELGLNWRK